MDNLRDLLDARKIDRIPSEQKAVRSEEGGG